MKAQHPFLDKDIPAVLRRVCHHGLRHRLRPHRPRLRRRRLRDLQALQGWSMVVPVDDQGRHTDYAGKYAGLKTEESNPVILADLKESGALFASEEIVHSLPPLLALQEPHHLPGHPPVVLLRGLLQGRGRGRLRRRALAPCLGQGPDDLHDPGAGRLVHQPPAPLGPAHPGVLLRRLRQAHRAPTRPSRP